jgi:hypothetical protein
MVRRHSASRSVDRRTVPSRLTSYLQNIYALRRRVCSPPSGARPCDGCCTCNRNRRRRRRRRRNWVVALRGGRTNWQTRSMGSGVVLLSPYVPFPLQFLPAINSQHTPWACDPFPFSPPPPPFHPYNPAPCLARSDPWHRSFTRCPRAWRVSGKVPIQVWWDWQKRRTSIPVGILSANTLRSLFFSGFYIFSSRLRKLNARFRRSNPVWKLQPLDPLINATHETARWAK